MEDQKSSQTVNAAFNAHFEIQTCTHQCHLPMWPCEMEVSDSKILSNGIFHKGFDEKPFGL